MIDGLNQTVAQTEVIGSHDHWRIRYVVEESRLGLFVSETLCGGHGNSTQYSGQVGIAVQVFGKHGTSRGMSLNNLLQRIDSFHIPELGKLSIKPSIGRCEESHRGAIGSGKKVLESCLVDDRAYVAEVVHRTDVIVCGCIIIKLYVERKKERKKKKSTQW